MNRKFGCAALLLAVTTLAASAAAAQDSASTVAEESGTTTVVKTPPSSAVTAPHAATPSADPASAKSGPSLAPTSTAPTSTAPAPAATAVGTPQTQLRPAQDVKDQATPRKDQTTPQSDQPYDAAQPEPGERPAGEINSNGSDQGSGWDAEISADRPTPLVGDEQTQIVNRIDAYFNSMTNLQGTFDQVDASDKHTTGRFYVQRPGKLRFDYAPPSPLRIVSDGAFLAIEDSDLKTVEKYPIESTPFRLLVSDKVDLANDARVVAVEKQDGLLAVTLEDKDGESSGQIKLVFENGANLKLKQWMITDAQGLTTTVTVNDIVPGRKVAADFFHSRESFNPFQ